MHRSQRFLRDRLERFEDANAVERCPLQNIVTIMVQVPIHGFDGQDVSKIALVVLEHERNLVERLVQLFEVLLQVVEALNIRFERDFLRIRDEDNPVDALEHELSRRVVEHLAGNGVEL